MMLLEKTLPIAFSIALLGVLTAQARAEPRAILYVANSGGDDVTVVDAETHRVIGSIETGSTPHGLIASPDGRRIYVTGETDDDVVAVDTATSKVLWKAKVGDRPNEPAITPDGRHIYVPIRSSDVADVVDTVSRSASNRSP
jgi:YVTN family beta-propeller protein